MDLHLSIFESSQTDFCSLPTPCLPQSRYEISKTSFLTLKPENWLWYACLKQATVTFKPNLRLLPNLWHSISDTIRIKMVYPSAILWGQNLPCKQTFVKYTHASFTKIIHNSVMLSCICPTLTLNSSL